MQNIRISSLAVATVILISGCGARPHYPEPIVFSNGVTYKPTWDGYNTCRAYSDRPNAECSEEKDGPIVKYLEPDVKATMESFIKNSSHITELCNSVNRLKLFPDYNSPNSCKLHVYKYLNLMVDPLTLELLGYSYSRDVEKAYQIGLIDKATWLIFNGHALEAYQDGLIDKNTARTKMLKRGQIIEAYQAKLIDKDTADLYMKQASIDNATRASQQQAAAIKAAADETNRQNDIRAMDAQSNQFLQQQIQNSNKYNKFMRNY